MPDLTGYRIAVIPGNGCCQEAEVELRCDRCTARPVATTNRGYPFTDTLELFGMSMDRLMELAEKHEKKEHTGA